MPSLPPGSRRERIEDYQNLCRGITWEEKHIKSFDGTDLALCIGELKPRANRQGAQSTSNSREVVILYFQGYENEVYLVLDAALD